MNEWKIDRSFVRSIEVTGLVLDLYLHLLQTIRMVMGLGIGNMYVRNNKTRTLKRTGHWIERNLSKEIPVFQMARQKYTRSSVYFLQAIFSPLLTGWMRWVASSFVPRCLPGSPFYWQPLYHPEEHGYYIIQMSMYTYNSWPGGEPLLSDPLWVSFVNLDGGPVRVDVLQYHHIPDRHSLGLAGLCDAIHLPIHPHPGKKYRVQ